MLNSMTGYGRIQRQQDGYDLTVELRAVNHRYLECTVKLPKGYGYLEEKLKECLKGKVSRGKLELSLTIRRLEEAPVTVQVNHAAAVAYLRALQEENRLLAKDLTGGVSSEGYLSQDLGLSDLMRIPELLQTVPEEEDADAIWRLIEPVLEEALIQFLEMRRKEGQNLAQNIVLHLDAMEQMVQQIEALEPESVKLYEEKMRQKLEELLEGHTLDESRLITEAAITAEKLCVDEELVRLHSHIAQFRDLLKQTEPVGRRMDFLVQEMNREVNTTGSKSQSLEITRLVVDLKSEIEKIREQIQNIE